ncbi:MAG TPA: GNAT family N-acetyltransferase [Gemmatimonadaceae bacterium]|jgi:GNAT superfamily N-acetyltransferase|nr:GNAT family N-acetyltransferase [Gemmatimonadaceae bacterium]
MIFRLATLEDIPRLAAMRWEFRAESDEAPVESQSAFSARYGAVVAEGMTSGRWIYWLAETGDGELVTSMAVIEIQSVPRPSRLLDKWAYLTDCYTRPAFRNQDVGTTLLHRVIAWERSRDVELILVWPSSRSLPFYERAGFDRPDDVRILVLRDFDVT